MNLYPIQFYFSDFIAGKGYVALVEVTGVAVLEHEDDGDMWLYGVNPGDVAGGSSHHLDLAFAAFKDSWLSILYDTAAEANTFDELKTEVYRLFREQNVPNATNFVLALNNTPTENSVVKHMLRVRDGEIIGVSVLEASASPKFCHPQQNRFDKFYLVEK